MTDAITGYRQPEKPRGLASFEIKVPTPDNDRYYVTMDTSMGRGATAIEAVQELFGGLGLESTVQGIRDYANCIPDSSGRTNLLAILNGGEGK